jgi:predicted DNA-binding protein
MFPVRLPERDHARLKQWCDNNGFPMAAVVRGLIERFLDERQPDGEAK